MQQLHLHFLKALGISMGGPSPLTITTITLLLIDPLFIFSNPTASAQSTKPVETSIPSGLAVIIHVNRYGHHL